MNAAEIRVHQNPWEEPYEVDELRRAARAVVHYGQARRFQAGAILQGCSEIFIVLEGVCEAFLLDGSREFAVAERYATHDFFMPMDMSLERDRFPNATVPNRRWRTVEATTCSILDGPALSTLFAENQAACAVLCSAINGQSMLHMVRRLQELVIDRYYESPILALLQYARFGNDGSIVVPVLIDNSIAPNAGPGGSMPAFHIVSPNAPVDEKAFMRKHGVPVHIVQVAVRMMWAAGHMRLSANELVFSDALCRWVRRVRDERP